MTGEPALASAEVTASGIPLRRFGHRFDIDEVDAFLDACRSTLHAWEHGRGEMASLSATDIVVHMFRGVRGFAHGYDPDPVDDLLDRVVIRMRELGA